MKTNNFWFNDPKNLSKSVSLISLILCAEYTYVLFINILFSAFIKTNWINHALCFEDAAGRATHREYFLFALSTLSISLLISVFIIINVYICCDGVPSRRYIIIFYVKKPGKNKYKNWANIKDKIHMGSIGTDIVVGV